MMHLQYIIVGGIVALALIFFVRRITRALRKETPDCGCGCGKQCKGKGQQGRHLA